ncbi:hypothetical protein DFH08DRAFT_514156 [Mycena albidolilacea]|uniref:Uncharacterized protein n=1 Tax=Mycena albidolilacea TaxID=1033008 RepID=A0AAD7EA59_9AGAR|nr:hypothetical protein DFH08DRAFT_514156 [Mycena albidolilacea]
MESYTIDRADFDASWAQANPILYETAIELVFYMTFVAMFAVSTYLYYHNKVTGARFLLYSTSAMFVLGTIQITLKVVIAVFALRMVRLAVEGSSLVRTTFIHDRVVFVRYILLTTNNAVTDSILIYRCYVVWGRAISVTFLPIMMLTAATILGYVTTFRDNYQLKSTISPEIAFIVSVATNSLLTTLTAGRMWWVGREVHRASSLPGTRSYNAAAVMILESGALYSFCVIAYLVSGAILSPPAIIINNVLTGALPQVVNIAPTLIAVRVGFRRGLEARFIDRASGSGNMTFTSIRMRSLV